MTNCKLRINNMPLHDLDKYVVARVDGTELWYYGTYDNEDMAYRVAEEIGNGIVVERL